MQEAKQNHLVVQALCAESAGNGENLLLLQGREVCELQTQHLQVAHLLLYSAVPSSKHREGTVLPLFYVADKREGE